MDHNQKSTNGLCCLHPYNACISFWKGEAIPPPPGRLKSHSSRKTDQSEPRAPQFPLVKPCLVRPRCCFNCCATLCVRRPCFAPWDWHVTWYVHNKGSLHIPVESTGAINHSGRTEGCSNKAFLWRPPRNGSQASSPRWGMKAKEGPHIPDCVEEFDIREKVRHQ